MQKVDKVVLPTPEEATKPAAPVSTPEVDPTPEADRGATTPEVAQPARPSTDAEVKNLKPEANKKAQEKKKDQTKDTDVLPGEEGLSPRQVEARRKSEKERVENPVAPVEPEVVANEEEGFVTIVAADPKVTLEASINDMIWKGHSITVPKKFEGTVRSLLETAGMYVKN